MDIKDLSVRLYDVLERAGGSEKMRRLHQRMATTNEILQSTSDYVFDTHTTYYFCGSSYEGSVTRNLVSDIDIIHCKLEPPVVLDHHDKTEGSALLIRTDEGTYPGYVKLQRVFNGQPITIYHLEKLEGFLNDAVGNFCIKHISGIKTCTDNGPAQAMISKNGVHMLDHVLAYTCNTIPAFAREWIVRERKFGWPSQQQIQEMSTLGCMFVGAGHVDSVEKDIEWRTSFSLQEKKLMTSLSAVQHKVYILLKLIKKCIVEKVLNKNPLTSYHCKTCLFYVIENTPSYIWSRDNLISCMFLCLNVMVGWLRNGYCPNYFIKDQNLFAKPEFRRLRCSLLGTLTLCLRIGPQIINLIKSDNIGKMLTPAGILEYGRIMEERERALECFIKLRFISFLSGVINQYRTFGYRSKLAKSLQQTKRINGHSVKETKSAVSYVLHWLHQQISIDYLCRAIRSPDQLECQRYLKTADHHFHQAKCTDLTSNALVKASFLLRSEKYDACMTLLQCIDSKLRPDIATFCVCTCSEDRNRNNVESFLKHSGINIKKILCTAVAMCVTFLPDQKEIVPQPLQYEMQRSQGTVPGSRHENVDFWYDWAVVDAKVYLYFLQYLASSKLSMEAHKRVAIDNLCWVIDTDRALGHKDTAYNLLGWIFIQEHRHSDAVRCFVESWRIRPFHNAAKFHMRRLFQMVSEANIVPDQRSVFF